MTLHSSSPRQLRELVEDIQRLKVTAVNSLQMNCSAGSKGCQSDCCQIPVVLVIVEIQGCG